jgi:DNA anti-recombination protein RmuC
MKRKSGWILLVLMLVMIALFYQCHSSSQDKVSKLNDTFEKEQKETEQELIILRDEINERLDAIEKETEKAGEKTKDRLIDAKENLLQQKSKTEEAIDNINKATKETWDDARKSARNTLQDVKKEFRDLKAKIADAFSPE